MRRALDARGAGIDEHLVGHRRERSAVDDHRRLRRRHVDPHRRDLGAGEREPRLETLANGLLHADRQLFERVGEVLGRLAKLADLDLAVAEVRGDVEGVPRVPGELELDLGLGELARTL